VRVYDQADMLNVVKYGNLRKFGWRHWTPHKTITMMESNTLTITPASKIVVSKDQVSCDLGGEAAMLHMKPGVYYGMNSVGARIWSLIQEPRTFAEIHETLAREYDVDPARLESDLRNHLGELAEQELIEISE